MLNKTFIISSKAAVAGLAFGFLLATSSIAVAADSPSESVDLEKTYLLAGGDKGEEAKCGEDKGEEAKCGEDKGEEAKCGEDKG